MTPSTNPARDEACDHVWSPPVATGRYCMLCDEPMPLTALAKPSSPAGGDVAIKPLLWHEILTHGGEALSANFGEWNRRIYLRGAPRHGRDAWIATEKAKAQADFDEYIRSALSPAPESGVDAVAVKALGPIPQFDSFAINPVGEGDICVEGSSRFAHERDVAKLFKWARAAQALLTSLSPAATSGSEAGGEFWTPHRIGHVLADCATYFRTLYDKHEIGPADRGIEPDKLDDASRAAYALAKPSSPAGGDVREALAFVGELEALAFSKQMSQRPLDYEQVQTIFKAVAAIRAVLTSTAGVSDAAYVGPEPESM